MAGGDGPEAELVEVLKPEKPEGFELITRYPAAVNEFSAQSVYKDGVLFVIAAPKESSVVEVPVLSVPKSSSGKSSNLRFQRD